MQPTKLSILLIAILLFTMGCGGALNSSSPPITDRLVQARLTDFRIEKGSDLILTLSEAVNIDKQIQARLLQPGDPIWKGELQEKSDDFPDYKYEIIFHDIKPNAQKKFTEILTVTGNGPITKVKGVYPPDDSQYAIYISIGKKPLKIRIRDLEKSKVLISVY
jgi:hypothetical protein